LVGDPDEVARLAEGALALRSRSPTNNRDLACFDNWEQVKEYVDQDAQGVELRLKVRLVEDFSPEVITRALGGLVPEPKADLVVTTAHKSKGREWGQVQIADDFPTADESSGSFPSDGEVRLAYVAATRAKRALDPGGIGYLLRPELYRETTLAGPARAPKDRMSTAAPTRTASTATPLSLFPAEEATPGTGPLAPRRQPRATTKAPAMGATPVAPTAPASPLQVVAAAARLVAAYHDGADVAPHLRALRELLGGAEGRPAA
jgi:hypothetical protein